MIKSVILFSFLYSMIFLFGCVPSATRFTPVDNVISQPFYSKEIKKLAILIKNGDKYEKRQIESGALGALISHSYTISSRADLKSLVTEINFQQSSFSDSDSAKFGKIINVPAVLVFGFEKKNDLYTLNVRLIDVETAEILYVARGSDSKLEKLAFSLSFEIPPCSEKIAQVTDYTNKQLRNIKKEDWGRMTTIPSQNANFSRYNKVAVLVNSKNKKFRNIVEDLFMMEFIKNGVTVSSRSDLDLVVKEIKFQHSGLTDNMSVRAGKILNVPAVVIVSAKQYRKRTCRPKSSMRFRCTDLGIKTKVIDVETGEIILTGGQEELGLGDIIVDTYQERMLQKLSKDIANYL